MAQQNSYLAIVANMMMTVNCWHTCRLQRMQPCLLQMKLGFCGLGLWWFW